MSLQSTSAAGPSLLISIGLLLTFVITFSRSNAQMHIDDQVTGEQLANIIVGTGTTITNVTLTSAPQAAAIFSQGSTSFGLTHGILLTSGYARSAAGRGWYEASDSVRTPGYNQLSAFSDIATYDACVLEFDVVPVCDKLGIQFIFGSEEYPEYVDDVFNDAFGFFISGKNPLGGNYTDYNVALLPGTNVPITINTVNNGRSNAGPCMNCGYYINNMFGTEIVYDGFTIPITVLADVIPNETYHLVIVISDAGDRIKDSGVFISESGITCSLPVSLISFTGEAGTGGNLLRWATHSEKNNKHFILERSLDGLKFDSIATLPGLRGYQNAGNYSWLDPYLMRRAEEVIYYRLSQTDYDGTTHYFKVIALNARETDPVNIVNSFVDANGKLKIDIPGRADKHWISVYTASGTRLFNEECDLKDGQKEIVIDLQGWKEGLYLLYLQNEQDFFWGKFVK